jgi:opacity protein-like surface antigen
MQWFHLAPIAGEFSMKITRGQEWLPVQGVTSRESPPALPPGRPVKPCAALRLQGDTMRLRSLLSAVLAVLAIGSISAHAAAQNEPQTQSRDENYFAAKLMLGIGGEIEAGIGNTSASSDAELTFGGGFAYMVPLHRYFVLGGQLSVQSWQSEAGDDANADRNLMGDLTVVPQGRLALTHDVEIYLAIPLGLSLDFLSQNQVSAGVAGLGGASVDVDPALGFTISFMAGARFWLADSFGLLAELGYSLHSFSHNVTVQAGVLGFGGGGSTDLDVDIGQFALNAGLFF